jgi:hypothetical protein
MDRVVALKVVQPSLFERPTAVARFRREVRAAALLAKVGQLPTSSKW